MTNYDPQKMREYMKARRNRAKVGERNELFVENEYERLLKKNKGAVEYEKWIKQ